MPYGLDIDAVRFEVDAQGNTTRAIVPLAMYTALTEFWIAARRAETRRIERSTPRGQFQGSLRAVKSTREPPGDAHDARALFAQDSRWQSLLQRLPDTLDIHPPECTPEVIAAPITPSASSRSKQTFFAREFIEPIPAEVAALIHDGMYFIKAWRIYRGLKLDAIAGLFERSRAAVQTYDYGYNKPSHEALERFAIAYDCTVAQLTVRPGTSTAPWFAVVKTPAEEFAPVGTAYPDGVKHSMMAGKSPLTAWRLYRGFSLAALAARYGERVSDAAIKEMEEAHHLSAKTRAKLAKCLKCEPVQLLKPAHIEHIEHAAPEAMLATGR